MKSVGYKFPFLVLLFAVFTISIAAAGTNQVPTISNTATNSGVDAATEADYQRTLVLLGITSLRHPLDHSHTNSPYYANYNGTRANLYTNLPDPLVLNDGQPVMTPNMWWQSRRPEIVEAFDREILGHAPANIPKVDWSVIKIRKTKVGGIPVITKKVVGMVDNSSRQQISVTIPFTLTIPADAKGPVPVIIQLTPGSRPPPSLLARLFHPQPPDTNEYDKGPTWQEQILAKGWGYAVLSLTNVQQDGGGGLTSGIIGLCNQGRPRKLDDWGVLKAWAWSASRVLDYFETDTNVDAKRVGIEGHSRYGKASLVAMAYDPRFAIGYISSSGEGGAKLYRHEYGEGIENVAGVHEYHWMAGNFLRYAGPLTPADLPVDAHDLIALCAPRPVFIGAGRATASADGWADAQGMFMAEVAAGPVYRLLGKGDLGTTQLPPLETALISGDLGFRQHQYGHTDVPNWPTFLEFAEKYFSAPGR